MPQKAVPTATPTGLPRASIIVIAFEFFERFGLAVVTSLLVLFLTGSRAGGGMGWSAAGALRFVALFMGALWVLPVIGGVLADRWIGRRRAVAMGGALMLLGYALLTSHELVPALIGMITRDDVSTGFSAIAAPLGAWSVPDGVPPSLTPAYRLVTAGFHAAILFLVLGYAFVKSTLVVLLGDAFDDRDERRHAAYAWYLAGINLGGLLGGIAAGTAAHKWGWAVAFAVPAVCMGLAVILFVAFRGWLPAGAGARAAATPLARAPHERARLLILAVFILLLLAHSIGMFQIYGTILLFLEHDVDRSVGSYLIPSPWAVSLFSGVAIVAAPTLARTWLWLHARRLEPDIVGKYALALILVGTGLLAVAWNAASAGSGWAGVAFGIILIAVSEVLAWTSTYGLVYRLAPARLTSAAMGGFYAGSFGVGGYLGGWLGQFAEPLGWPLYFLSIGIGCFVVAALSLAIRPPLKRLAARSGTHLRD